MPTSLLTTRLELTEWCDDDRALLSVLVTDPEVMRYIRSRSPWSPEFTRRRHEEALEHWAQHGVGWLAIRWRHDGTPLGMVGLNHRGPSESALGRPAIELGWLLVPSAWGRGAATEAVLAARDHAFDHADVLYAQYQSGNDASGRIMTKVGMTHHADRTDAAGARTHLHVLTRAEWSALG